MKKRSSVFPAALIILGTMLVLAFIVSQRPFPFSPSPSPTRTPEPVIPTKTPAGSQTPAKTGRTPLPGTAVAGTADPGIELPDRFISRFGVTGGLKDVLPAREAGLPFGVFASWAPLLELPPVDDLVYWQMVRTGPDGVRTDWTEIGTAVSLHPGAVWIVGNEPDVRWQDNVEPGAYARQYHEVYTFIKSRDPTAQLAIAGVALSTPLRRAYLDRVLDSYQAEYGEKMPVDIWTVHAYTLREEADSWGVDIPPGVADLGGSLGRKYEIADHGRIDLFAQNLIDFRSWMAERGYQERPLAVTEFGIIMPNDYGFPPEMIADYMAQAFDFFQSTANETGYPADNYRLVQWWFWFSLYQPPDSYPTPNLFDPASGELSILGKRYADYIYQNSGNSSR